MALSIGKKILLSLLVVALIPLLVAGLITYRLSAMSIKEEVIAGLSNLSESTLEHFVDYVDDKKLVITMLAQTPALMDAMGFYGGLLKNNGGRDENAVLDASYRALLEGYNSVGFNGLYLISFSGDIVFSLLNKESAGKNVLRGKYEDTELAAVFKRARETSRTEVSEFKEFAPTKKPAAFMSAPVRKGAKILGFVVFQLDTGGLYAHVKNYSGLGETGEIVLAGLDGANIVFAAPLRHDPDAAFKRKVRIGSREALPMQHALNKESGSGISIDYRGQPIVAVWTYFAPMHLGLVIKQDTSEAFSLVGAIRRWLIFVGAVTLLLVMAVSAFVARSIAGPIKALHKGTERVGEGDLSYRVGTLSKDEIGQLSRAFDDMTVNLGRITASRDELDKEIRERREVENELRESKERLQGYSKNLEAMVDKRTAALKALQNKLITKEKLAAIGQLSSSVGHELRNPLGVINNSVYYLKMKLKGGGEENVLKHLNILSREVGRSNRIISDLLDFSRERALELSHGDINELIGEALSALDIAGNVVVDFDSPGEIPAFSFDADQIHQLIVNLVTNALQAMPDGGRLCIRTGEKDGAVEISFEDSGVGVTTEDITRIFDPLYTTRTRGTGLGLSIVKGIVERHGGTITVESKVGEGTTFIVRLPLDRKAC